MSIRSTLLGHAQANRLWVSFMMIFGVAALSVVASGCIKSTVDVEMLNTGDTTLNQWDNATWDQATWQ